MWSADGAGRNKVLNFSENILDVFSRFLFWRAFGGPHVGNSESRLRSEIGLTAVTLVENCLISVRYVIGTALRLTLNVFAR
jgi:hypothetical protein